MLPALLLYYLLFPKHKLQFVFHTGASDNKKDTIITS